jgi:hypothetical protein
MIKLELTVEEVQIALVALSKLPYEAVAGVIDKIKSQAQPQVQPAEEPAAE